MNLEPSDLRHSGYTVVQTLREWPAKVIYQLAGDDIGIAVHSAGYTPHDHVHQLARAFASAHRITLTTMLRAAHAGNFRADHHCVMWKLRDQSKWWEPEASALFLARDNPNPACLRAGASLDLAAVRTRAVDEFTALPEDERRRLFAIAAQGVH